MKIHCVVIMLLAFLSTFTNASFVDFIIPGYILLISYTTINSNLSGYLSQFFVIVFVLIMYDLIWLIFASTVSYITL